MCHAQSVSVGDIDGDGALEVVFGTSAGGVHALRGASGLDVPGFPFRTHGRIMAPVLLAPLVAGAPGLHLVVQSYDGHLYAIHGETGVPLLKDADEGESQQMHASTEAFTCSEQCTCSA